MCVVSALYNRPGSYVGYIQLFVTVHLAEMLSVHYLHPHLVRLLAKHAVH